MAVPQARERPTWGPVVTVCCLATLLGGAVVAAEPSATLAAPVPAVPFQFAPTPLALPVANSSLDRQITALLRSFRDIQRSEAALSGEPGQGLSAQIVLQVRAGATLEAATLQSLVTLIVSAVPGLSLERLNIASGDGAMLVAQGRVVAAPRSSSASWSCCHSW